MTPLELQQFPPCKLNHQGEKRWYELFTYLKKLLEKHHIKTQEKVILPSLTVLAQFFSASQMDIHAAFQILRQHGYDYELTGLDRPITFWYCPNTSS